MTDARGQLLRLRPNRVWRTYTGGLLLDQIEGKPSPTDGPFPEDWIGSTLRATNPDRDNPEEGLSRVTLGSGAARLVDLVTADPQYFLGAEHVARFGSNPMLLVKYLDSAVRLPLQVHPTPAFSRQHLNSNSGKTEAYYILATRPEAAKPFIYLGFQHPPGRAELRRMIIEQDIAAMERCFDKIPVRPGDIYVVPGGLPHAIGGGVLMVEVMEPTDFVARVEFSVAGRTVPEPARFMGRDVDFALDLFSFEPVPVAAVQSRWRCAPALLQSEAGLRRESLVDERVTDKFVVLRTTLVGSASWKAKGFTVLLVVEGACTIAVGDHPMALSRFDRILVPHGMGPLRITAPQKVVFLECLPPVTARVTSN